MKAAAMALLFVAALIVALVAVRHAKGAAMREATYRQQIELLKARVAEAETRRDIDSVEVVRWVTRTKVLRDTINIRDTVQVLQFIARTDTLRERCLACVSSASALSESYKAELDFWRMRYEAVRPGWWDRALPWVTGIGGVYLGTRACRL